MEGGVDGLFEGDGLVFAGELGLEGGKSLLEVGLFDRGHEGTNEAELGLGGRGEGSGVG